MSGRRGSAPSPKIREAELRSFATVGQSLSTFPVFGSEGTIGLICSASIRSRASGESSQGDIPYVLKLPEPDTFLGRKNHEPFPNEQVGSKLVSALDQVLRRTLWAGIADRVEHIVQLSEGHFR
ncbi:hypothetical protein ABIA41_002004 [Bradyrhizobium sp. USDA 313]